MIALGIAAVAMSVLALASAMWLLHVSTSGELGLRRHADALRGLSLRHVESILVTATVALGFLVGGKVQSSHTRHGHGGFAGPIDSLPLPLLILGAAALALIVIGALGLLAGKLRHHENHDSKMRRDDHTP